MMKVMKFHHSKYTLSDDAKLSFCLFVDNTGRVNTDIPNHIQRQIWSMVMDQ